MGVVSRGEGVGVERERGEGYIEEVKRIQKMEG